MRPQGSGSQNNANVPAPTPSSKTSTYVLPGYIANVLGVISDIGLVGLPVSFPAPVGVISRVGNMAGGNLIVERASDGGLFTIRQSGLIYGPITGKGSWPAPSFEYLQSRTGPTETTGRQNVPLAGLPMGTLPSPGAAVQQPGDRDRLDANPNVVPVVPIDPNNTPPPPPETPKGMSLLMVAGLVGAAYFAAK